MFIDSGNSYFAFKWDSTFQIMGSMGSTGEVRRSNNDGSKIVGWYKPSFNNERAFLWTSTNGLEDLNIKYSSLLQGNSKLNYAYSISGDGRFIVGWGFNSTTSRTEAYILDTQSSLYITEPTNTSKFIAGETSLIKWTGGESGQTIQIEYTTDNGTNWFFIDYAQATNGQYVWDVPATFLTTKAKIKITDVLNTPTFDESDKFKIKPYILTRIDQNGDYYEFRKDRDQWGFWNNPNDMWPETWWRQFNYYGTDPFTGAQYSQTQGHRAFANSKPEDHTDWVSWVRAFGVNACYKSTSNKIYNDSTILSWRSVVRQWKGSCFGIAASNALAFRYRDLFTNRFPIFPNFTNPNTVASDSGVKRVVNELYTHQYGNPSTTNDILSANKTPVSDIN